MSRRTAAVLLGIISAILFAYSRWIEPSWIEVTRHQVLANIERPLKIIHLSDLHTYELGARERRILEIIRKEEPDAILISGDTVANEGDWKSVGILLSRLRAPLGVFLVRGNWEHWRPNPDELKVYESAVVTFLNISARSLSKKVWVVGLDDSLASIPDQSEAFKKIPRDTWISRPPAAAPSHPGNRLGYL
jgi:predicted MPP superfamily phosphohydrolase